VDEATMRRDKHGKVLRGLLLTKLSQHLSAPAMVREVGLPTVLVGSGQKERARRTK
jgi:hypothetical protein